MRERHQFAIHIARSAGEILKGGFTQQKTISFKAGRELVTEYDLNSETFITEQIQENYPQDGILAEEGGEKSRGRGRWVIDPLDGTTNYAHGVPFFVVSIAYVHRGKVTVGVVFDPIRDECFHASHEHGAWIGDIRLRVSNAAGIQDSLLATGSLDNADEGIEDNLRRYSRASRQAQAVRRLGSAALHLAYVAAGRMDGYWEQGLSPWDWAAGILLVQEAGGKISRIDGGESVHQAPSSILASNNLIHDKLVSLFRTGD